MQQIEKTIRLYGKNFKERNPYKHKTYTLLHLCPVHLIFGNEYRYCRKTLDVYLIFAIWIGQSQSKLIYIFETYGLATF